MPPPTPPPDKQAQKGLLMRHVPLLALFVTDEQNGDDEGNNRSLVRVGGGPLDGVGLVRETVRILKAMKDTHLVWGAGEALCWDIEKLLQILTRSNPHR